MSNNKSIKNTSVAIRDIINTFKIFEKYKVKIVIMNLISAVLI